MSRAVCIRFIGLSVCTWVVRRAATIYSCYQSVPSKGCISDCVHPSRRRPRPLIAEMPICASIHREYYSIQRFSARRGLLCLILYVNRDTALLHPAACVHALPTLGLFALAHLHFFLCLWLCGCRSFIGAGFTLYDSARCTRLIDLSSRCGRPEICIGFVSVTLAALASCFMAADFAARHMSRDSLFTQMKFRVSKRR